MILNNDLLEVKIDNLGAEIIELRYCGELISHDRNPDYWGRNAPVLFPFVGQLKNTINKNRIRVLKFL